jgi:hypothetical protein
MMMIIIIIRSEEEDGQRALSKGKKGGINTNVTGRHIPITMRESHAPTQQRGGPFSFFLPETFDMKKERDKKQKRGWILDV